MAYKHLLHYCFQRRQAQSPPVAFNGSGTGELTSARGLQAWEIEVFPKFGYSPKTEGSAAGVEMSRDITECVVCLAVFKEGETLRLIPTCAHVFHADCVDVWLRAHATCPCCRAYLNIPSAVETSPTTNDSPV
ncbi:hypothetical protein V2J09_019644 [Rumex salicifolius]